jgi:EmrB/QacA subfamily drug resistance transporter
LEVKTVHLKTGKGKLILSACILASGVGFLMGSAVTIALPQIQSSLETDIQGIQWIVNAYTLMLGTLILISGSLGDIFGVRRIFNLGIAIFTLGSLLSGLMPSVETLIAVRGIQGMGAALMVPGSLAIINRLFPKRERGKVIGLWAGISGAIAALGPFFGGFLSEISWRLVFLSMVPLGIAAFTVSWAAIPRMPVQKDKKLDWPGIFSVLAGLSFLSFGLIRASEKGFDSTGLALLISGVFCLGLFFFLEAKVKFPLISYAMFSRQVTGANLATFFLYFAFQGILFLLSFYLQQLIGFRPMNAGLSMLPATLLITVFSGPSGSLTDRIGPRFQMIAGPLLVAAACGYLLIDGSEAVYFKHIFPAVFVLGVGMVLIIPSITTSALNVKPKFSGAASGVNNALARIAGLFAIALIGTILALSFRDDLRENIRSLQLSRETRESILGRADKLMEISLAQNLSRKQKASLEKAMERAFSDGYRRAMGLNLAAALLGAFIGFLTIPSRKKRNRKKQD